MAAVQHEAAEAVQHEPAEAAAEHEPVEAVQRYEAAEAAAAAAEAGARLGGDPAGYGRPWAGVLSANLCLCVELFGERHSHS